MTRSCPSLIAATAGLRRVAWRLVLLGVMVLLLLTPLPAAAPVLALTDAAAPASADGSERCAAIREAEVAALFSRWNDALASGDPDRVVELYSPDALLLPTLSAEARSGHAAIRAYFEDFLARSPRGRIDSRTIRIGCNSALDAGTYSFLVRDPLNPERDPSWVNARYSFVYGWHDGGWRIDHHHSSLQPAPNRQAQATTSTPFQNATRPLMRAAASNGSG